MPGKVPSLTKESLWQMPQASTFTRTCPGPGSGTSRSTSSNGPFGLVTWTTRILAITPLPLLWPRRAHRLGPGVARRHLLAHPAATAGPLATAARQRGPRPAPTVLLLVLLADRVRVTLPVREEELLPAHLPRGLQLGCADVPVGSAFLEDGTQVLAEVVQCRAAEEPVAHVYFIDDQTRLEHERVRDHGIVSRISVFSDIEVLLDHTPGVGQERP